MSLPIIRKVVIPAAGLGTRWLPATKVIPKEMLPIADRPLIQYAVEEAVASGITQVILVVGPGKELLRRHFEPNPTLEETLSRRGHEGDVQKIRQLSEMAEIRTVWQPVPLGLAHAIETARPLIDEEPFAVILPDALIYSEVPCIQQLTNCYERHPGCIVAIQKISTADVDRFGVVEVDRSPERPMGDQVWRVVSLLERPQISQTKSRYGIFGRYILNPDIFSCIRDTPAGRGGEYQLTDSLALYAQRQELYGYLFDGQHYDAGSKLGFLQATLAYALRDKDISMSLRIFLEQQEQTFPKPLTI